MTARARSPIIAPLTSAEARWVRWSARLYRVLLMAYPRRFRRRYGVDMRALFADKCRDDILRRGRGRQPVFWLRTLRDIGANAAGEWRALLRARWNPEPELHPLASRRHRSMGDHLRAFPREIRFASRSLLRTPGFAVLAALTLGVGIGASATIFSLVNGVLLQPLPYPDASRLVALKHRAPGLGMEEAGQSDGTFFYYRNTAGSFDAMGLYVENVVNLTGEGEPERVPVALGTGGIFTTLGAIPLHGRLLTDADALDDAARVVVISHGLWQQRFGADPAAVGGTIELNSVAFEIVGVLPESFEFPRRETQVWYALDMFESAAGFAGLDYPTIARLAPGISPQEAEAELRTLIPGLAETYDDATLEVIAQARLEPLVRPLKDEIVGDVGDTLWFLLVATGLVMLIACANVANLFLVRAEYRQKEVAVRRALGASGFDLARFYLAESALLATVGVVVGLVLAYLGVAAVVAFGPGDIPRLHEVGVDGNVLAFAIGLAGFTGLLLSSVPLFRGAGTSLTAALKEASRTGFSPARQRAGRALVVAQMATALTLLVASALMVQSFWKLAHVDPGFDAEDLLTFEFALPRGPYPEFEDSALFSREILRRISALPGVVAAGAVNNLPLTEFAVTDGLSTLITGDNTSNPDARVPGIRYYSVTPGFFEAMRIPLIEGRLPVIGERVTADNPILISAALAQRLFGSETALGKKLRRQPMAGEPSYLEERGQVVEWNTVVGVVGSVRYDSMTSRPAEIAYLPVLDRAVDPLVSPTHMSVAIRTSVPPINLVGAVRQAVWDVDAYMPIANIRTMEQIVAASTARTSFTMLLLLAAGAMALFLGTVGIYGVISYTVSRRTHEIGVRIALGANARDVRRMVVFQGTIVAVTGIVVGIAAALGLTRLLESLLFEVSASDPATYAATAVALTGVAMLASYLPARRAAQLTPLEALRSE